jgi:hypothetical protein
MSDAFQLRCEGCGHQTPMLGWGFCSLERKSKDGQEYLHGLIHPVEMLEAKELGENIGVAEREGRVWVSEACHCQACGQDFAQYQQSRKRFEIHVPGKMGKSRMSPGCVVFLMAWLALVVLMVWLIGWYLEAGLRGAIGCAWFGGTIPAVLLCFAAKEAIEDASTERSQERNTSQKALAVRVTACPGCLSKDFVQTPGYQGSIDRPGLKCPGCGKFAMKMVNHTFG